MKMNKQKFAKEFLDLSDIQVKEDFLHYVWKYKLFQTQNLVTVSEEYISIQNFGIHNLESGPDFFNAKLRIDKQLWAGNVELHVKSSDWYAHKHEKDSNYDAVILHVVWEYDVPVFRENGNEISTLELKNRIDSKALKSYKNLFSGGRKWILCEKDIATVDAFSMKAWLTRLYFERLEMKSQQIFQLLKETSNDWEAVLFQLLAKNFGMKLNGDAFLNLAKSFDFSVLRKVCNQKGAMEYLLLGQAGFLEEKFEDIYFLEMRNEYQYLKRKFKLTPLYKGQFLFFRLRPANFPTIRISQLASLYEKQQNLFSKIIAATTREQFYELFSTRTSAYWETHYVFEKQVKPRVKKSSNAFVDLLLINTIIPLKYAYYKQQNKYIFEDLEALLESMTPEKNGILKAFDNLNVKATNGLESQALLQLKNEYCSKQRCLECAIGMKLMKSEM